MTPVHLYADGDEWVVHAAGAERRFGSRAEAFGAARDAARRHSPSRIVNEAPPRIDRLGAGGDDDDQRSTGSPSGASNGDDPALAHLGPRARAALARARSSDADDPDQLGWGPGGPTWDGDPGEGDEPDPVAPDAAPRQRRQPSPRPPARVSGTGNRSDRPSAPRPPAPPPAPVAKGAGWTPWDDGDQGWSWERLAGPRSLGRSVVLVADAEVPPPWVDCHEVLLGADDLDDPDVLAEVREAFLARTPMIYRVDDIDLAPDPASVTAPVWRLPVDLEITGEVLWHLALANAVDARDLDAPVWSLARRARDAGASRSAVGDVSLADGRIALCDGGPLRFWPGGAVPLDDGTEAVVIPRVTIDAGRLDPVGGDDPDADLAPDQLESVGDPAARSRIVAPAGSGKTRVLTERARYLIRSKQVPAGSVCLVAFNKRAQEEMGARTRDLPGLQIQTLNALALSIVNGRGTFARRDERVTTLDELQVRRLLAELVSFPRRANTDPAAAWLDALSMVRLGLRDPAEVEAEFNGDVDGFAAFFDGYRRELQARGAVDFDDQIYRAIEVLVAEPATRAAAQASCRVLLVDEFQDLTPAHLLLIRLLAGAEADVFGVGDDDQTIYGYSGASPDWLIEFDRYFPGATHHALEVNYRCPAAVVAAAANLLSRNRHRVPKQIRPGPRAATGDTLRVVRHAQPVEATAARVVELVDAGVAPTDIVVLSRVNTLLAPVQVALGEAGLAVLNREGGRFLERTGVAAALSWVRLATRAQGLGGADIERAARRPGRSISPRMIEWMSEQRDLSGLRRLAGRVQEKDRPKVEGFADDVERIQALASTGAPTDRLVRFVRNEIGLDRAMQTLDSAHRGRNSAAHSDDLRALIALGSLHPDPHDFEAWLRTALDGGRDPDGVQLSTVHRVKGLEWPHVIVHDASEGTFPHRLSTDVEEERRVFHVAITRCQADVTIVADAAEPSLFLDELAEPGAPAPEPEPAAAVGRSAAPARGARTSDVAAAVGLEVQWGGYECTVAEIDASGAVLLAGRARFRVAFGSTVTVDGKERRLVATSASPGSARSRPAVDASAEPVLAALREWRADRAKADAVPAYVIAKDATLEEIASARPGTPQELLAVHGIGPAKLERYGDEILALLDDAPSPEPEPAP